MFKLDRKNIQIMYFSFMICIYINAVFRLSVSRLLSNEMEQVIGLWFSWPLIPSQTLLEPQKTSCARYTVRQTICPISASPVVGASYEN